MNVYDSQKKALRRFLIQKGTGVGDTVSINGQDANHIRRVLRLKAGDRIEGFDGEGKDYRCEISQMLSNSVRVVIKGVEQSSMESPLSLTVAVGFLKEKKMDRLVRQLTELGVRHFVPFFAERSIPVLSEKRLERRLLRWEKIATESLKQCRRSQKINIVPSTSFDALIRQHADQDQKLVFWEDATLPISESLLMGEEKSCRRVLVVIGPEGGFSPNEIEVARREKCHLLSMGKRILRAETAVLFASSLIQYLYGDLGGKE